MGKLVVSWSPVHGQGTTTSNIAAIASYFALTRNNKSIITHTQLNYSSLELLFGKKKTEVEGFEEHGLKALERLIVSGFSKTDIIFDYTETIYSERLDLLGGTLDEMDLNDNVMLQILERMKSVYDVLFVDAHSGSKNELTNTLLANADLVIVNLPQNRFVLDRYFSGKDMNTHIQGKDCLYIISEYNDNTQFNIKRMKRMYPFNTKVLPIPYSKQFRDASNSQNIAEFFYTHVKNQNKGLPTQGYVDALEDITSHLEKTLQSLSEVSSE
jgi:MinD-like ATPase involved in chromosome partitioning or flagellar assembly